MGDPTKSGTGILGPIRDVQRRIRNLEKAVRLRLNVGGLFATGDVSAGGNVTGAYVAAYAGVSGLFVRAVLGITGRSGTFTDSVQSPGVRQNILTNVPVQMYVDADGNFGIAASTRAKKNIGSDYAVDMTKFLNITLKNWAYKDNPSSVGMGPIADDLDAAGLREFVIYSPIDGSIQGVRTDMLIVGLWSAYVQSRASTLKRIGNQSHQVKTVTNMTALALGGTKAYAIVWDAPFVDADYLVTASVYSSAGIPLTGVSASCLPSARTATGCTVQVTSGVTLLAGQTLVVEAIHI